MHECAHKCIHLCAELCAFLPAPRRSLGTGTSASLGNRLLKGERLKDQVFSFVIVLILAVVQGFKILNPYGRINQNYASRIKWLVH